MNYHLSRPLEPFAHKFTLEDLSRIAPWVYDEIRAAGIENVKEYIAKTGEDPDDAQSMTDWVLALQSQHSDLWRALQNG